MAYRYQSIWDTIKSKQYAEITVSRDRAATVIQGVKRTKSAENAHRSSIGLIPWSRLKIETRVLSETTGMMLVRFELSYDTRI